MTDALPPRLTPSRALLLVVDWQERLVAAMPEAHRAAAQRRAETLVWLATELDVPVLVTEQYPRGLGPTVAPLQGHPTTEKLSFSAAGEATFATALAGHDRDQILLLGMETHVCVAQTCEDLRRSGRQVWTVADACLSRHTLDWQLGLDRMRADGATVTSMEAVGFALLRTAEAAAFKGFSRRIR